MTIQSAPTLAFHELFVSQIDWVRHAVRRRGVREADVDDVALDVFNKPGSFLGRTHKGSVSRRARRLRPLCVWTFQPKNKPDMAGRR